MLDFLHHLVFPRESNNHRARILHIQPLLLLVSLLAVMVFLTPVVERKYPEVLGITANITAEELVNLTNKERAASGLPALTLDSQLSSAAMNKASDMLSKNYWAHNAPDGTTPWVFIKAAGYDYLYAGENLARGFTSASDAMGAWMASPGHKDNILSSKYKDVGFAIVTGTLTGEETVLIVQEFGNRTQNTAQVGSVQNEALIALAPTVIPSIQPTIIAVVQISPTSLPTPTIEPISTPTPTILPTLNPSPPLFVASLRQEPLISKHSAFKNIALVVGSSLLSILVIDIIVIERKKIFRIASHSIDHILFLTVILLAVILYSRGLIL